MNKEYLKELILKHFTQIFIWVIFYFYYVGYVTFLFENINLYGNLLYEPNASDIISNGIFGFLVFILLISFGVCIYEVVKFAHKIYIEKGFKSRNFFIMISLLLVEMVFLYLIYKGAMFIISKAIIVNLFNKFLTTALFFIFFSMVVFFVHIGTSKTIKNKIFISLLLVCITIFLIFYPWFVYGTLVKLHIQEAVSQTRPISTVMTSISLNLPNEQKTGSGYLNKIMLVKSKDKEAIFVDPLTKQIVILKREDIINIKLPLYEDIVSEGK